MSRIKRLLRTISIQQFCTSRKVKISGMSFPVRPYIHSPLRCYKCQRYITAVCKGKQKCPKCGGDYRVKHCRNNVQHKCCNCGGQRRITYGDCEVRKTAVEIEQVKAVDNISYEEAVKRVKFTNFKDHK